MPWLRKSAEEEPGEPKEKPFDERRLIKAFFQPSPTPTVRPTWLTVVVLLSLNSSEFWFQYTTGKVNQRGSRGAPMVEH